MNRRIILKNTTNISCYAIILSYDSKLSSSKWLKGDTFTRPKRLKGGIVFIRNVRSLINYNVTSKIMISFVSKYLIVTYILFRKDIPMCVQT